MCYFLGRLKVSSSSCSPQAPWPAYSGCEPHALWVSGSAATGSVPGCLRPQCLTGLSRADAQEPVAVLAEHTFQVRRMVQTGRGSWRTRQCVPLLSCTASVGVWQTEGGGRPHLSGHCFKVRWGRWWRWSCPTWLIPHSWGPLLPDHSPLSDLSQLIQWSGCLPTSSVSLPSWAGLLCYRGWEGEAQ